jgi:hypothetical protein
MVRPPASQINNSGGIDCKIRIKCTLCEKEEDLLITCCSHTYFKPGDVYETAQHRRCGCGADSVTDEFREFVDNYLVCRR